MSEPPPVALVTAGSAGLGAAAARLFAKDGMRVIINYNSDVARAQDLVAELRSLSSLPDNDENFLAIRADLSKREDIVKLVEDAVSAMGRLDVVFSNGGWTHIRGWESLDDNVIEEDWDKCFSMNVKSHLFLMHAVKRYLDQTEGAFITTASLAGVKVSGSSLVCRVPVPVRDLLAPACLTGRQAYAVTKAAQIHLAKGLAVLAAPKIRVNSVSPGLMMTVVPPRAVSIEYNMR